MGLPAGRFGCAFGVAYRRLLRHAGQRPGLLQQRRGHLPQLWRRRRVRHDLALDGSSGHRPEEPERRLRPLPGGRNDSDRLDVPAGPGRRRDRRRHRLRGHELRLHNPRRLEPRGVFGAGHDQRRHQLGADGAQPSWAEQRPPERRAGDQGLRTVRGPGLLPRADSGRHAHDLPAAGSAQRQRHTDRREQRAGQPLHLQRRPGQPASPIHG